MKFNYKWMVLIVLTCSGWSHRALADCVLAEEAKRFDPVEVGFCESDAVFVGKVEGIAETIHAFTEEGTTRTKHFDTQRTTIRVLDRHKGTLPDKITMIADLYAKEGAYAFESGKTYLVFAKRLVGENEYAGASATCSLQPTLHIEDANKVLKQLEQRKKGQRKIDCKNIRPKEKV
jgi:hypothetical protein